MDKSLNLYQEQFLKNIDFFEKYYPQVITKLNLTNNQEQRFTIVLNDYEEIQLLNLQFIKTQEYAYSSNPINLAKTQVANALQDDSWITFNNDAVNKNSNIEKIICISNGLGYNLIEYDKFFDLKAILIVEEDIEVFKLSLFNVDYRKLCKNKMVDFCLGEDDETTANVILKFYYSLFFYNNAFKVSQCLNNNSMHLLISTFQENLNETLVNKNLEYDKIIDDSITHKNYELKYKIFVDDVFNKQLYTKQNILIGINLLHHISCTIELQKNSILTQTIYCALYYITNAEKNEETLHILSNSINFLAKEKELNNLDSEIYTRMTTLISKDI